jgi:phospholipid/cholesterol/gamma-HCH transport system substrate-binding protein
MGRTLIETVMGTVVIAIAAVFLVFAYISADLQPVRGHAFNAKFASIGGLRPGSDVRIGGVKVGSVTRQTIDPKDYRATVTFTVKNDIKLPADTVATITSDGLLGGKYLRLKIGTAKDKLKPGATLENTRDALALEELLSRAIFLLTEEPAKQPNQPDNKTEAPLPK